MTEAATVSVNDEAWFRDEFLALAAEWSTIKPLASRGGLDSGRQLRSVSRKIDQLLDAYNITRPAPRHRLDA